MAQISIFVTTAPRQKPTFDRSLSSLHDSLIGIDYTIVSSPDENKSLGCFGNFHKCLEMASKCDSELILVTPDDVLYDIGWYNKLPTEIEDGYYAIYTPKGLGKRYRMKQGWNKITGGWANSWGGAYVMKPEVAKKVIANSFYQDHLHGRMTGKGLYNYAYNKRIDHVIPEVMHRLGFSQYFYAPSLIEHIGYTSTIGHTHTANENRYTL